LVAVPSGLDIEGHQSFCVGYIERLFIAAERHAVCAHVLACDEADLARGIDEVGAIVIGEVDTALGIADEFAMRQNVLPLYSLASVRMPLALFDDDQLRRLMALVGMAARIRAGALNADDTALVVDAESSGAVRVRGKDGEFVLWIEPADGAGCSCANRIPPSFVPTRPSALSGPCQTSFHWAPAAIIPGIPVTVTCFSGVGCGKTPPALCCAVWATATPATPSTIVSASAFLMDFSCIEWSPVRAILVWFLEFEVPKRGCRADIRNFKFTTLRRFGASRWTVSN